MFTMNGKVFRTLNDQILLEDGRQVLEVYEDGVKVYPEMLFGPVVKISMGWDTTYSYSRIDLDLYAVPFRNNQDVPLVSEIIYYGHQSYGSGAISHIRGDDVYGTGSGDDETIVVRFNLLPEDVCRIVFIMNVFSPAINIGQSPNAYIRIHDDSVEYDRCDLTHECSRNTSMIFGELYKKQDVWEFRRAGLEDPGFGHGTILDAVRRYYL